MYLYIDLLPIFKSQVELGELFCNGRDDCQPKDNGPFSPGKKVGIKDRLQEWHRTNQEQKKEGQAHCILHPFIRKNTDAEDGCSFRTNSVGSEQLAQREGYKGHCFRSLNVNTSPVMLDQINNGVATLWQLGASFEVPEQT